MMRKIPNIPLGLGNSPKIIYAIGIINRGLNEVNGIVFAKEDFCRARKNRYQETKFNIKLPVVAHMNSFQMMRGIPSINRRMSI